MEVIKMTPEEAIFAANMNVSLANAIRRSVGEIDVLAIDECDIYKNDSALYDEIIAHRLGLISIKNQKLGKKDVLEFKLAAKGTGDGEMILAGTMGKEIIYPDTPIVLLGCDQEIEIVAKARVGKGKSHAKFMPGLLYYKHLPKVKLSNEGEKQTELVDLYPKVFKMYGEKVMVENAWQCEMDGDDVRAYPGVDISFDDTLVFIIESWGQMNAKKIFTEACRTLKNNLSHVSKVLR
jgi:DNA-directed RNA polymerase subunit D